MPLYKRGAGIRAVRFGVEPSLVVGETPVGDDVLPGAADVTILAAYLGEDLVWNGRVSQLIQVPVAKASAAAPLMAVSTSNTIDMPVAVAYAEAFSPAAVRAGVTINVPTAAAYASAPLADSSRDQIIVIPTASAVGDAPTAEIAVSAGSTVFMEVASAVAEAPNAGSSGDALVEMPVASAFAEAPTGAGLSGFFGEMETATATASAPNADVATENRITFPVATASASAPVSAVKAGATTTPPTATATASAPDGTWATPSYVPMGMDKVGTQTLAANAWFLVTGWTVRAGYPNTVIASNGLVVETSHDMVVHYRVQFSGAGLASQTKGARVKINGAVIHTVSAGGDGTVNTFREGSFSASLLDNDVITLEAFHGSSVGSNRVIQEGAAYTFLYFDAA